MYVYRWFVARGWCHGGVGAGGVVVVEAHGAAEVVSLTRRRPGVRAGLKERQKGPKRRAGTTRRGGDLGKNGQFSFNHGGQV